MGFEIINAIKKEKGLTNAQISSMSGVTLSTLDKITSGVNKNPKLDTLQAICRVLGCTLNDFADTSQEIKNAPSDLSEEAKKIAKDYDRLTDHGKGAVRLIMEYEGKAEITATPKQPVGHPKVIPLPKVKRSHGFTEVEVFDEPAAAGLGNPIETPPSHMEQYPVSYTHLTLPTIA